MDGGSNLQVAGLTNKGMERVRNEDSFYTGVESGLALLVVADGMGGHRAGNVASAIAVELAEQIWHKLDKNKEIAVNQARSLVGELISEANRLVFAESERSPAKRGMGTTLTTALICENRLTIGHVGDSRAYRIRDGKISLLTKDHSLIEQLIESGQVKPEEAENHPQRHILTRALGVAPDLEVDITELEMEPGSTLLLCTDGLTNMIREKEILDLSERYPEPQDLAEALINLANDRGGFDNITVAIASDIGGPLN